MGGTQKLNVHLGNVVDDIKAAGLNKYDKTLVQARRAIFDRKQLVAEKDIKGYINKISGKKRIAKKEIQRIEKYICLTEKRRGLEIQENVKKVEVVKGRLLEEFKEIAKQERAALEKTMSL